MNGIKMVISILLLFCPLLLLSPVTAVNGNELDCHWQKVESKKGVSWRCTGKDCEKCSQSVESKANSLGSKNAKCCCCERDGDLIICRGECCAEIMNPKMLSPTFKLR